jgi:hypothetical protein
MNEALVGGIAVILSLLTIYGVVRALKDIG